MDDEMRFPHDLGNLHFWLVAWNMNFTYTLWLFNMAMENDPFIDDVPIYRWMMGW